jgi:hypothetical protein
MNKVAFDETVKRSCRCSSSGKPSFNKKWRKVAEREHSVNFYAVGILCAIKPGKS